MVTIEAVSFSDDEWLTLQTRVVLPSASSQ